MRSFVSTTLRTIWPASSFGRALVGLAVWSGTLTAATLLSSEKNPINRPLAERDAGYVSSDTCRSCHPGNYASWHASFHRTMTQLATPANVLPPLDGVELALDGFVYRVERKDDAFFVRKRAADATAFGAPREIVLLTGSHHQQNFWLESGAGRSLEAFPFGWLVAEKMWAPVGDTFLSPPEEHAGRGDTLGAWNGACVNCHATHGRGRFVEGNTFDTRVAEFGIACEACHSEGRAHIDQNRNPLRRYFAHLTDRRDATIANPARLNGPASALACGQCHSVWAFSSMNAKIAWDRDGAKFRPGQSELPERFVAQPALDDHTAEKKLLLESNPHFFEDTFWPDGQVRVTGREYNGVQLSPCFKGGNFSCLSCHEMHPKKTDAATLATWSASQMKSDATSDAACLQCHQKISANLAAHTHHAPESTGSRCYDCHMPHSGFGLLGAVRSHQITSPTAAESVRTGRPNACNLCHLDQPLAWTAEKLHAWYGQPLGEYSRDDREIAAGAKWMLAGDAAQRALVAWSMGWAPAQKASGHDWLAPYLAITLNDSYAAVRFVAWKSLRTLPGFENFSYVYTAPDADTYAAAMRAYQQSLDLRGGKPQAFAPAVLLDSTGRFARGPYQRLLDARDQRRVYLVE